MSISETATRFFNLLDKNKGENDIRTNINWLCLLTSFIVVGIQGIFYLGIASVATMSVLGITGLIGVKILFDNRINILNNIVYTFKCLKEIKRRGVINSFKKALSIDRVLCNAINRENPDLKTIELCLKGRYWDWKNIFKYKNANINEIYDFNDEKISILELAAKYGKEDVINFILKCRENGINQTIESDKIIKALKFAVSNNNIGCIIRLVNAVPNKSSLLSYQAEESIIHFAARESKKETINELIRIAVDIKREEEKRQEPDKVIAEELISLKDSKGNTPLHIASENGNVEAVKELLRLGVNIDTANVDGDTPLHLAVRNLKVDVVGILMRDGANPSIKNKMEQLPITIIKNNQCEEAIKEKINIYLLKGRLFALDQELEQKINIEGEIGSQFERDLTETQNLEQVMIGISKKIKNNINQRLRRIAVIGKCGAGKSSIINALAMNNIAPAGDERDLTKYPSEYIVDDMSLVDFPGFSTTDYTYQNFEKYFHWDAYDLVFVIIAVNDKIGEGLENCLVKLKTTIKNSNVIFIHTFLNSLEFISKNDNNTLAIHKQKRIDNIKSIFTKNQGLGNLELTENVNVFFVSAPTEDPGVYKGVKELREKIDKQFSFEKIYTARLKRVIESLEKIKQNYIRKYSICDNIAETDWKFKFVILLNEMCQEIPHESEREEKTVNMNFNIEECLKNTNEYLPKYIDSILHNTTILLQCCQNGILSYHPINYMMDLRNKIDKALKNLDSLFKLRPRDGSTNCIFLIALIKAYSNNKELMDKLSYAINIIEPINIAEKDDQGKTLLMYAAGNISLLSSLMGRNTYLNGIYDKNPKDFLDHLKLEDNEGKTALIYAVNEGDINSFCCILNYFKFLSSKFGADINKTVNELIQYKDKRGKNVLLHSIENNKDIALFLLESKEASVINNQAIANVRGLINISKIINDTDIDGKTALIYAVQKGYVELVKLLLQKGADPKIRDGSGKSVVDYAEPNEEICQLLTPKQPELASGINITVA